MPLRDNVYSVNKKYTKQDIVAARKWFQERIVDLQRGKFATGTMSDIRMRRSKPSTEIGSMVYFKYDPKHKATLPYYDIFPLAIMIDENKSSFLGLNLHYLPPNLRIIFLGRLLDTLNNTKFDRTTKLRVNYGIIKEASKYKYFRACIKRYLKKHFRSPIQFVRPEQWHKAILLPAANFKKASEAKVWADSRALWSK